MKFRRWGALLLAGAIGCASLSGCGGDGEKESGGGDENAREFGGITITLADPWGNDLTPGKDEETDKLIDKIDAIEEKYDIVFEWKQVDSGTYWNNMATVIMSGQPFGDIMYSFPWMITDWIKAEAVRDAGAIAESVGIDFHDGTWNETVLEEHTYGDVIYGFSKEEESVSNSLLYNKRLFREAGLTDPNELIASGGKWDFATMEEYARQLTKRDAATGRTMQWGLSSSDPYWLMTNFILSNGGGLVDYSVNPPTVAMDSAKSLEGLEFFNRMLNTDQTIYFCPAGGPWETTPNAFANGTVGMYHAAEWLIEYIRDMMNENGTGSDYGLTYFPMGPQAEDYIDQSLGGSAYFIPTSISEEKAQAALLVYSELMDPSDDGYTKEQRVTNRAEALFADEASCRVYEDLMLNRKIKTNGASRLLLREPLMEIAAEFTESAGTPQSLIAQYKSYMQNNINDSGYVKAVERQQGTQESSKG